MKLYFCSALQSSLTVLRVKSYPFDTFDEAIKAIQKVQIYCEKFFLCVVVGLDILVARYRLRSRRRVLSTRMCIRGRAEEALSLRTVTKRVRISRIRIFTSSFLMYKELDKTRRNFFINADSTPYPVARVWHPGVKSREYLFVRDRRTTPLMYGFLVKR